MTASSPPRLRVSDLMLHLLLPGQAFAQLKQPRLRLAWTVFALLSMAFISFQAFYIGDKRWLLLWPVVAVAAAWHYAKVARQTRMRTRGTGELLYLLAAMTAWLAPLLLSPTSGGLNSQTQKRELAVARSIHFKASKAATNGRKFTNGPCPSDLIPRSGLLVDKCELFINNPLSPDVNVTFSSGRRIKVP